MAYSFAWSNETSLDLDRTTRTTVWASSFWGDMGRAVNLRRAHQNAIYYNDFAMGICAIDDTVSDNTFVDNAVTCEVVMAPSRRAGKGDKPCHTSMAHRHQAIRAEVLTYKRYGNDSGKMGRVDRTAFFKGNVDRLSGPLRACSCRV